MKKLTAATLALCIATLTGCSSSDDEEELVLPEIVNQFETDVVWQESIGDGVQHYFSRLTPAIHNDVVYVANREGEVEALSLENGDTLWQTDVRENPAFWPWETTESAKLSGGILQAYGKIFVGSEHGYLTALDRETGEIVWRKTMPGEVLAKPAAGDGLIFVNLGSGKLLAVHPDTGEERWRFEQEVPPLTLRGQSSPTVANGGVLLGLETGKLSVLISENGYSAWSAEIASPKGASEFERLVDVDTQALISGPYAYAIAYNGNLAAVDIRSGNVVWKREYSSYRDLSMDSQSIYVVDSDGVIYSLDKTSGIERWSQPALRGWYLTGPTVAGKYLALGDQEGNLHWLDKETGELVSREDFDSSGFFIEPVVAGDKLILYTRDGEVSAVKIPN
ncbi:outer membrane protein assembly factor BamB [Pseudoalteromonas sp. ACER1]|jgi:outer membrane protein assembly factor BamB|uniref:Outer membrane protein assembly factor BamB n=1 Tax=Pseudoalteromonas lipolytica TaxID=570156 RepID=A0A0P7D3Y1_9GAMM|nr:MULTISPECIES: outer membrane protein assembly factor BamB [Pseudoalteromonas]MED5511776.1 outer membrane protein assembly factor BamB [Pseudomonadota bacterium]KPM83066.1 serine/threonine protein kinase [Pseudoalteromonas lipolytica]MCF2846366.1 outer membrane protein assembly factor BamB [Pseudoalteromonas sp. PAST1]MCH2088465.1 outer membrane protein assembly factor BamB [Pseudoalteromonas sp.]MCO7209759.1 outer membrane protein assembly factor BamB [Pseudoalteromonas sp. ACER1]